MTRLYAQPYDISAIGFYFESYNEYKMKALNFRNDYGDRVEEFEIQFIDGEHIDCDLAKAWTLYQSNISEFFDAVSDWNECQKLHYIIAVGECGYSHDQFVDDPKNIEITIYRILTMRELAEQFVEEGLYGEIPEHLEYYIDYDRIARDLECDYNAVTIAGEHLLYRAD